MKPYQCRLKYFSPDIGSANFNWALQTFKVFLSLTYFLLPPATEVWGKVMFLLASVCPQGEGVSGGLPYRDPPGQRPTPPIW